MKTIWELIYCCKDLKLVRTLFLSGKQDLESREKKVADIMMVLYDEEEAMKIYVESERYDEKIETARRLIDVGKFSLEDIAAGTGLTIDKVREIANLQMV